MIIRFVILTALIITIGCALPAAWAQDSNIEINLDVIDRFAKPIPDSEKNNPVKTGKTTQYQLIPPPPRKLVGVYPDGTLKSQAIIEYERSLEQLRAKYFPETHVAPVLAEDTMSKGEPTLVTQTKKPAEPLIPAPRKIEPIPAPSAPPPRQVAVEDVIAQEIPAAPADKAPSTPLHETASIVDKDTGAQTDQKQAPHPSEIKGLKIVSIAYIDEEITLNENVRGALTKTYIPRLKAQQAYRVGLYSYSSTINRSDKEAKRLSLERALALKDFLIQSGMDGARIDIFPAGEGDVASFSDWIDIILQK